MLHYELDIISLGLGHGRIHQEVQSVFAPMNTRNSRQVLSHLFLLINHLL